MGRHRDLEGHEKIEAAIYGGLTEADQERLEKATLTSLPNAASGAAPSPGQEGHAGLARR
jgi:hypothetical protein